MFKNMKTMNLSHPHFGFVASGLKTVEGRLNIGKWKDVVVGDEFCISSDFGDLNFYVVVTDVVHANTFEELYMQFGEKLLPHTNVDDKPWMLYEAWFPLQKQKEFGVVGIVLQRTSDSRI